MVLLLIRFRNGRGKIVTMTIWLMNHFSLELIFSSLIPSFLVNFLRKYLFYRNEIDFEENTISTLKQADIIF